MAASVYKIRPALCLSAAPGYFFSFSLWIFRRDSQTQSHVLLSFAYMKHYGWALWVFTRQLPGLTKLISYYSARPTMAEYEIQLMTMAPSDPKIKNNANAFRLMISCVLVSDMSSAPGQNYVPIGCPKQSSWIIHTPLSLAKRYFGSTTPRYRGRLSQFARLGRITYREGKIPCWKA